MGICHAASGVHLRELLRGNHRYVFILTHKFQTPELLCDRPDVIVLTDEAHHGQYDTLALNMRAALPKALFLAFTGTPLIAGEDRTKDVFGDYVSTFDFQRSVEDGATVPHFCENRVRSTFPFLRYLLGRRLLGGLLPGGACHLRRRLRT